MPAQPQDHAKPSPAPTPALVSLSGVAVSFGGRPVLDAVDLEVAAGEIVTLIGPNGAGKSTLLHVVLGLVKPARGLVRVKPGLRTGYLPQRVQMDPVLPLSVRRFLNLPRRHGAAALAAALGRVGADYVMERPVSALSGGELQRVLLARALLREPELLILDEPLQGVDLSGQTSLFSLIGSLRQELGCAIIMVSHDLHVVMAGTDRVVCLNRHVCCSGKPEAVSHDPAYIELFGPRAARELALYSHHHDHQHDLAGGEIRPGPPAGPADAREAAGRDAEGAG
jgi:zinc transport system ATP-binding protein